MIELRLEFQVEVLNGIQDHYGRRISTESWLKRKLSSIQADRFAGFFIVHNGNRTPNSGKDPEAV